MLKLAYADDRVEGDPNAMEPIQHSEVALVSMVSAIREVSEALNRVATRQDRAESKIDDNGTLLNGLHTRLTVLETSGLATRLDVIYERLTLLEHTDLLRVGERGVWAAILKSPAIGWVVAAAGAVWVVLTRASSPGMH